MNYEGDRDEVREGDTVVIYLNPQSMYSIKVTRQTLSKKGDLVDNVFQTSFGALQVKNLIGKKFGHKINFSSGWGYVLKLTPELWTLTLPHRTQILYTPDISVILMNLDLKAGSVVVESGTGSGSLSHAFIRAIAPTGHLHTFDFHEKRVEIAEKEFSDHGLAPYVSVKQTDACKDGFPLENIADAVFLDLPSPWLAIKHACKALKKSGGRICSFSPCIEQTQKTCEQLTAEGFTSIETLECLQREYQYCNVWLKDAECEEFIFDCVEEKNNDQAQSKKEEMSNTPIKVEKSDTAEVADEASTANITNTSNKLAKSNKGNAKGTNKRIRTLVPALQNAGHTGYLTFATWPRQLHNFQVIANDQENLVVENFNMSDTTAVI